MSREGRMALIMRHRAAHVPRPPTAARMSSLLPRVTAWVALNKGLRELAQRPDIATDDTASEFLSAAIALTGGAPPKTAAGSLEPVIEPLRKAFKSAESARIASLKNAKPREWAVAEWTAHGSEYESRADFARIYTKLIVEKYGPKAKVSHDTITDWLKGH